MGCKGLQLITREISGLSVCTTLLYSIVASFYCLTWSLLLAICDVVCAVVLTVVHTETTEIHSNANLSTFHVCLVTCILSTKPNRCLLRLIKRLLYTPY